jgi:peptide/nickel transport system permease protein
VTRYLVRRLLQAVLVVWLVTVIVFVIARLSGNPVDLLLPIDAPRSDRAALIHHFGLDRPWPVQYAKFVGNAVRGDFGRSTRFQAPAMRLVLDRLPATIELAFAAVLIALLVGIPLGILGALRHGRLGDLLATSLVTLAQATPAFWLGILLVLWFGVSLEWLPLSGDSGFKSLILPAVTLSIVPLVPIARMTRSSLIGVLPQDYVRTARAKGLREHTVVTRYVLRNGLIPVVTIGGLLLAELLSGAVIVEQVFAWPGIGRLAVASIEARDFAVVQAVTLFTAAAFVGINLIVDLVYVVLDPRIRLGARAAS